MKKILLFISILFLIIQNTYAWTGTIDNSNYIWKYIFTSDELETIYIYELWVVILIMILMFFYKILDKKNYNYLFKKR